MKVDDHRLSFSIQDDSFYVTDSTTGNTLVYSKGKWVAHTLDDNTVINHIKSLQEAMMTYKPIKASVFESKSNAITTTSGILIRENGKQDWSVCHEEHSAVLENNNLIYWRGFDYKIILNRINFMFTTLLSKGNVLNPKRDIVRRIADVGILVWVYNGKSLVVYEKCIHGCCMKECLINGVHYETVIVNSSRERGTATLFDISGDNMKELITLPLDTSILEYYPPDEDAFT